MAGSDLVERERELRGALLERSKEAEKRAVAAGRKFDVDEWATGARSPLPPYGPPYEPVVQGIPGVLRSMAGMSALEWGESLASSGVLYGVGAVIGARVRKFSPVSPRVWGASLGGFGLYTSLHANATTSAHRLMGFRDNGRPLRPGYEGWKDDAAPAFLKMRAVSMRHPNTAPTATASAARAFD